MIRTAFLLLALTAATRHTLWNDRALITSERHIWAGAVVAFDIGPHAYWSSRTTA